MHCECINIKYNINIVKYYHLYKNNVWLYMRKYTIQDMKAKLTTYIVSSAFMSFLKCDRFY